MPTLRPTPAERAAMAATDFEAITALRLRLHHNGHPPVPVTHPDVDIPSAGKAPRMSSWQEKCPKATPADIMLYSKQYPDHTNTGIACGKIGGIDIDIPDPELSAERIARAQELFGPTPLLRIGKSPKTLLVYRLEAPHDKFSTPELWFGDDPDNKEMKVQVEFLGSPRQQFVGFGIHPDTREEYQWPDKSLLDVPLADVPLVKLELLQQFCSETEQVLRRDGARSRSEIENEIKDRERQGYEAAGIRRGDKPTYEKVQDALNRFPNDVDRRTYINVGYAIYDGLGEAGWSLFEGWAKQHPTYNAKNTISDWRSFRKRRSITVGTLFWLAGQKGWKSKDKSSKANGKFKHQEDTNAQSKPEPPRPLIRELPPADPFPIDALGDILGNAANGIHDKVQAPMAICAQSVLAAATLTVQGYADIELPTGDTGPVSNFYLTVAASGDRKSAADKIALWAIRKRETALRAEYDDRIPWWL
jgi:putative DNA primase/helicase